MRFIDIFCRECPRSGLRELQGPQTSIGIEFDGRISAWKIVFEVRLASDDFLDICRGIPDLANVAGCKSRSANVFSVRRPG